MALDMEIPKVIATLEYGIPTAQVVQRVKCEMPGCRYYALFDIRRIKTEEWLKVCRNHDVYIGRENLSLLGHSEKEIKAIEIDLKEGG